MQESDQSLSAADHSDTHANKKRKMIERVVVAVKIDGNDNKNQQRNEGPPSDRWSWRKYGQKPIKGSPYPRGYYRCSTSKGCSAKKQVERCKTDSSMLIITYTSSHNHPDPTFSLPAKLIDSPPQLTESQPATPNQEHEQEQEQEQEQVSEAKPDEIETPPPNSAEDQLQFSQSPLNSTSDQAIVGNPFEEILQTPGVLFAEDPKPLAKSEENDFYDELEELPTSSFFTAFMKSNICEERIAVNLS